MGNTTRQLARAWFLAKLIVSVVAVIVTIVAAILFFAGDVTGAAYVAAGAMTVVYACFGKHTGRHTA